MRRSLALLLAAVLGELGAALAQPADPSRRALEDAERAREAAEEEQSAASQRARAARAEEERLAARRVASAAQLHQAEEAAQAAAAALHAAEEQAEAARAAIANRAGQLAPLLPLMQRLAVQPAETLLTVPAPPDQTMAGLMLLRAMGRRLEHEAAGLAAAHDAAERSAGVLARLVPAAEQAVARQQALAGALDAELEAARTARDATQQAVEQAARRAEAAALRSTDLRQAILRLEAEQRAEEARTRAAAERAERVAAEARARAARETNERAAAAAREASGRREEEAVQARRRQLASRAPAAAPQRGGLLSPIAGRQVRGFGDRAEGPASQGIAWRGGPAARVISPCDGRVVFAGPFRTYGRMLILDCGGGYHFVLAGLDRLDARAGASVAAGEPVGVMADYDARRASEAPSLYGELRFNGAPVDPAPFLRSRG